MINKNFKLSFVIFLLIFTMFCGCTEKSETSVNNKKSNNNHIPIGSINAPKEAYFDQIIEFDASDSYVINGEIKTYQWDFGDGTVSYGKKVTHLYNFQQEFDINYPLIYTIFLFITDNDNKLGGTSYQISLYPKSFTFYLSKNKLITEKPEKNKEIIKSNYALKKEEIKNEFEYEFDKFVTISKCTWNLKIYLEKPLLFKINKLVTILLDIDGNEISSEEYIFKNFDLWTGKYIVLSGKINSDYNFKSLKVTLYSFSLRNKVNIIYGGDNPSYISFDFF
jgi:hypothetical protein